MDAGCLEIKENIINFNGQSMINVREYEGTIKNGQSRETGQIWYTRQRKTKQKRNTICIGHHCTQTNTNKVNKI